MSLFKKATKKQSKLRAVFEGPSGSGKTYSSLRVGRGLVGPTGKIAVIDTEQGSASKYADDAEAAGEFDVVELFGDYNPRRLIDALKAAVEAGYDLVIADSLTHFWNGPNGFLEMIDQEMKRQKANNQKADSFGAWKVIDPIYKRWIQDILAQPIHFIGTLRAKSSHEKTTDDKGKVVIKKLGMEPEFRASFEYEFDLEAMLNMDNTLTIGKTRCKALKGKFFEMPGQDMADILKDWLESGAPAEPPPTPVVSDAEKQFESDLREAKGNTERLATLRTAIATSHKHNEIDGEAFRRLGAVYAEVVRG